MVPSCRDLGRAGAVDQGDREIAEGGQNLWGVASAQAGTVFLEADIPRDAQRVRLSVWIRHIMTRFSTPHRIVASKQIERAKKRQRR